MDVLEQANLAQLVVGYLQRWQPEHIVDLPPDQLAARATAAIVRGVSYGLRDDGDLAAFVDLDFRLGEQFDQRPPTRDWATEILTDSGLAPDQRLQALRTASTLWLALQSSDPQLG